MRRALGMLLAGALLIGQAAGQHKICLLTPISPEAHFPIFVAGTLLAASHVNSRNTSLVPSAGELPEGFSLEIIVKNTEEDESLALDGAIDCAELEVSAIVGAARSSRTVPVAHFTRVKDIAQVSFASTSTELSDTALFPTFFRTQLTDAVLGKAIVKVAQDLGWLHIGVIAPKDSYGESVELGMREAAAEAGMSTQAFFYEETSAAGFADVMARARASGVRIFTGAFYAIDMPVWIEAANDAGLLEAGHAWVLGDTFNEKVLTNTADPARIGRLMDGFLHVVPNPVDEDSAASLGEMWSGIPSHFDRWRGEYPDAADALNPAVFAESTPSSIALATYCYNALFAMAFGLARTSVGATPPSGIAVFDAVTGEGNAFRGMGGDVMFDATGNRAVSYFNFRVSNVRWGGSGAANLETMAVEYKTTDTLSPVGLRFPGGITVVPSDGSRCQGGTEPDPETRGCAYRLAIIMPYLQGEPRRRTVTAVYLAAHHINTRNTSIVPEAAGLPADFRIVPYLYDSQFTATGGLIAVNNAMRLGVSALIGSARSAVTIPIATLAQAQMIPQISHASTSRSLSNKGLYPYFARTIPTDDDAAYLLALTINKLGWQRVAMLFPGDEYGINFFSALQEFGSRYDPPVEVVPAQYNLGEEESIVEALTVIKRNNIYVSIFLVFANDIPNLFFAAESMGLTGLGHAWVAGDIDFLNGVQVLEAAGDEDGAARLSRLLSGCLRVAAKGTGSSKWPVLVESFRNEAEDVLGPKMAALMKQDNNNFFAEALWTQDKAAYAYDGAWALALAIAEVEKAQAAETGLQANRSLVSTQGNLIMDRLLSLSFGGVSGSTVDFTEQGDRKVTGLSVVVLNYYVDPETGESHYPEVGSVDQSGLALTSQVVWPGNSLAVPADGTSCEAGSYFSDETLACKRCPLGHFASVAGLGACLPCPAGTFCDGLGCNLCTPCQAGSYQPSSGETGCESCPSGTRTIERAADSLSDCTCDRGYYRRDGAPGLVCYECPTNGVCDGEAFPPYPAPGYWGDWSLVPHNTTGDEVEEAAALKEVMFRECAVESCGGDCGAASRGLSVLEERTVVRECRSDADQVCSEGRKGRVCKTCSVGWFSLGGRCTKCKNPTTLFVVGCLCMIVFAWYFLNSYVSSRYDAFDLMLTFLQVASMISTFGLRWHEVLQENVFNLLQIVNFDIDFFTPECYSSASYDAWSYWHGFALQITLPFLIIFMYCTALLGTYIWYRFGPGKLRAARETESEIPLSSHEKMQGGRNTENESFVRLARSNDVAVQNVVAAYALRRVKLAGMDAVSGFTMFVNCCYHTYTIKALEFFSCLDLPDGSSYLAAAPEVTCWEGAHLHMIPVAILAALVYTVGVPMCFFCILRHGAKNNLFKDPSFSRKFGWMFLRYEKEWYWWELVILGRRFLFCLAVVEMKQAPMVQATFGIAAIVVCICAHFYARAFLATRIDYLETISMWGLLLFLCCGAMFYDDSMPAKFPAWREALLAVTLCAFSVVVVVLFALSVHDVMDLETRSWLHNTLAKSIAKKNTVTRPTKRSSMLKTKSSRNRSSSRKLSADRINPRTNAVESSDDIPIIHAFSPRPLYKWLTNKEEAPVSERGDFSLDAPPSSPQSPPGESPGSSRQGKKRRVSLNLSNHVDEMLEKNELAVARLLGLNEWTKHVLAEDGPVSYYSRDRKAIFYTTLLASVPSLIDYLVHCTAEEQVYTLSVLRALQTSEERIHSLKTQEGEAVVPLYQIINPTDHAGIAYWLLHADEAHLEEARHVINDIRNVAYGKPVDDFDAEYSPAGTPKAGGAETKGKKRAAFSSMMTSNGRTISFSYTGQQEDPDKSLTFQQMRWRSVLGKMGLPDTFSRQNSTAVGNAADDLMRFTRQDSTPSVGATADELLKSMKASTSKRRNRSGSEPRMSRRRSSGGSSDASIANGGEEAVLPSAVNVTAEFEV